MKKLYIDHRVSHNMRKWKWMKERKLFYYIIILIPDDFSLGLDIRSLERSTTQYSTVRLKKENTSTLKNLMHNLYCHKIEWQFLFQLLLLARCTEAEMPLFADIYKFLGLWKYSKSALSLARLRPIVHIESETVG